MVTKSGTKQHIMYCLCAYVTVGKGLKQFDEKLEIIMPLNRHVRFGQSPSTLANECGSPAQTTEWRAWEMHLV